MCFFLSLFSQGICPGNRLKIIPTSYDSGCYSPSPVSSPCPSSVSSSNVSYYNCSSNQSDCYENSASISMMMMNSAQQQQQQQQTHSKRRSWHIMPNKVRHVDVVASSSLNIFCHFNLSEDKTITSIQIN